MAAAVVSLRMALTSLWTSVVKKKLPLLRKKLFIDKGLKPPRQHEPFFGSLIPALQITTCSDLLF
jgi:hypothetical protein